MFKVGDKVRCIFDKKAYCESANWAELDNIHMGNVLIIYYISPRGWLRFSPTGYVHPPEKFELVVEDKSVFKVGDWVIVDNSHVLGFKGHPMYDAFRIGEIGDKSAQSSEHGIIFNFDRLRYATGAEIAATRNKESFQIGDWVYAERSPSDYRPKWYIPLFQIKEITKEDYLRPEVDQSNGIAKIHCRFASHSEIEHKIKEGVKMNSFVVDIKDDQELSKFIQEKAFASGYRWMSGQSFYKFPSNYLVFQPDEKELQWTSNPQNYTKYTVDRVLEFLSKPVFKEGDWVTVLDTPNVRHFNPQAIGYTFTFGLPNGFRMDSFLKGETYCVDLINKYHVNYKITDFRLATQEEIGKAKTPLLKIGNYEVEFVKPYINVGCLKRAESDWLKLFEIMDIFDLREIYHSSGTMATYEDIKKIVSRINS